MTAPWPHPLVPAPNAGDWMHDRLTEARGVLADVAHHPDTLVILAARVVSRHTDEASECADAIDLLRLLDRRRLHSVAAAAFPTGGDA